MNNVHKIPESLNLEEKLIKSYAVKPHQAERLREIVLSIQTQHGYQVKESQIIDFMIDWALPRLTFNKDKIDIDGRKKC